MARWALISGLRGDLEVYEAIQEDLRQTRRVDTLFVLGDVIGPARNCDALLSRLQQPRRGELQPQCLFGWWEDQLLAERGYRGGRRADALRLSQGETAVDALLQAVDPGHMGWRRSCSSASSSSTAPCCMAALPLSTTAWAWTAHRCCCLIGSPAWR